MSKLVARHARSFSNFGGGLAFRDGGACLTEAGKIEGRGLGGVLTDRHGITNFEETAVAVSTLRRSPETAMEAGFRKLAAYPCLDEVIVDIDRWDLADALETGHLPEAVIKGAERVLEDPPEEEIWVSHGLLIAGLSHVLEVNGHHEWPIPDFCEVRELPI